MASTVKRQASRATSSIFKYDTNKIVEINSIRIGLIYKFFQLLIIAYVIGYVMIYMKGYQQSHSLTGSVVTKVKGISHTLNNKITRRLWDIPDLVVPPQEKSAFFITTHAIITSNQTQSSCPESHDVYGSKCKSDLDCSKGDFNNVGNGIKTGNCVVDAYNERTCEIFGWCPLENDTITQNEKPLSDILSFTVFIKNTIIFDTLNVTRSNLFLWDTGIIPKNCLYDKNHIFLKYCPIFNVASFLGPISKKDLSDMLIHGGIVQVIITWDCNLDYSPSECKPEYTFNRLDHSAVRMSKGWNFRYAYYYNVDGKEYRTLYKVFGLRVLIEVRGNAGKLSVITMTMNIGSGVALLAIATVVCDLLIIYVLPNRKKYENLIYQRHDDDDAYKELDEEEDKMVESISAKEK